MKETAGGSKDTGRHDPKPAMPTVQSFERLATAKTHELDSAACLDGAGECAKVMAFFQARQTEFLAEFGRIRTDRETGFDDDAPAAASADDAGADTAADAATDPKATDADPDDDEPCKESAVRDLLANDLVRWAGDEVACELDVAGITGTTRLLDSLMTVLYLPQTLKGLKTGTLSARRFRKVVEAARDLPETLVRQLDAEVAKWDERTTFATFSRRITRWKITNQPKHAEKERRRTAHDRSVQFCPGFDGAAWLSVFGPADRVRALYNMIDAAARTHDGTQETEWGEPDKRTLDQLRFDLLTAAAIPTQGGNTIAGSRYRVGVTVPVATLLGSDLPGYIAGYGPIPAGMARKIAAGVEWIERILVDPITGRPIDADRRRYRLSTRMKQFIHARDPECTLPSCSKPAEACEIDQPPPQSGGRCPQPWVDGKSGGLSDADNLHPACKSHHQAKTFKRFQVEVRPHHHRRGLVGAKDRWRSGPRLIRWTLPSGRHYDVLDDNDPTAARLETQALETIAVRAGGPAAKNRHRHWRWRVESDE